MIRGFGKVAAVTPGVRVCDVEFNKKSILDSIKKAAGRGAKVIVFPELCLTGYTCGDMFLQRSLLRKAEEALLEIAEKSGAYDALVVVGLPMVMEGNIFDVAAVINYGKIIGLVPKAGISASDDTCQARYFARPMDEVIDTTIGEDIETTFGCDQVFACEGLEDLKIGVCVGGDVNMPECRAHYLTSAGATLILNPGGIPEGVGKRGYARDFARVISSELSCGYVFANCGQGESTTDLVFAGGSIIAENGVILAENKGYDNDIIYNDIDVDRLNKCRMRSKSADSIGDMDCFINEFALGIKETELDRRFERLVFVPRDEAERKARCEEIITIQCLSLKKRLEHTGCKAAVVGISGGLDSTLALIVTVKTFDMLGLDRKGIVAVTMPCFGTTDRTYNNAVTMIKAFKTTFREIDIKDAVTGHFKDIGHNIKSCNATYENAQARERTQILMDIANKMNGIVVGTGDLSELALGWATYNGDHMSMYGVNASVPKTLVRTLVRWAADNKFDAAGDIHRTLLDIVDTPISPELLPADKEGQIAQKTEDTVGPYELHDFFLYHFFRSGAGPDTLLFLARKAFAGVYDDATLRKWLETFLKRFFQQQFKRSCLPDGPKVGSVSLSPRGDWRAPSDLETWWRLSE